MIKNKHKLNEFYRELEAKEKLSYKEALALGAISHENIWDGFEVDLRIARAINGLGRNGKADKKNRSKIRRR